MTEQHASWFGVRRPLPARRAVTLKVIAFLVPLAAWCAVSYVPFIWHPMMRVTDAGGSSVYSVGDVIAREAFAIEQDDLVAASQPAMAGERANPPFLPKPHEVGRSLYTAFTTEPLRKNAPWLHERIGQSLVVLAEGFLLACLIAVPLGVLCGTFDLFSKLIEPFVDFMRYMPAPAFGALMVAIFGLADAPKVAVIFIGVFFNMLLVTANTVRTVDASLLEAAQTLGASRRSLVTRVVVPGAMPILYNDLRIALGVAWVYLTIAELVGEMSGISEFINQQGKFHNYPNVFAGIAILGCIGFLTDQLLGAFGRVLFPWHSRRVARKWRTRPKVAPIEARPVEPEAAVDSKAISSGAQVAPTEVTMAGRIGDVARD